MRQLLSLIYIIFYNIFLYKYIYIHIPIHLMHIVFFIHFISVGFMSFSYVYIKKVTYIFLKVTDSHLIYCDKPKSFTLGSNIGSRESYVFQRRTESSGKFHTTSHSQALPAKVEVWCGFSAEAVDGPMGPTSQRVSWKQQKTSL